MTNRLEVIQYIKQNAIPLDALSSLDALVEAIGDARYVLLGESSHGTADFYTLRAELSKRLITEEGFSFIAVEGDWPACFAVNRYIKGYEGSHEAVDSVMQEFQRWPTWMWANEEIRTFVEWLKTENVRQDADSGGGKRIGFYGIDVYSLWESMDEIVTYLRQKNAPELPNVLKAFSCFESYGRDAQTYGLSATYLSEHCEDEVLQALIDLRKHRLGQHPTDEGALSAEVNARVAVDAERYYRAMFAMGPESWNIRDSHMVDVLDKVMDFYGQGAKCIVWEHNTHIGDARYTDMADEGMVNVGQLLRERHEDAGVFAVGFGTYEGTVIAADEWGAPIRAMPVPKAQADSWEELMHEAAPRNQLLLFNAEGVSELGEMIDHRAIGVVYDPRDERGNYVPTILPKRYDAFVYVDRSRALTPIRTRTVVV